MADLQIHNFDFNKLMEFASTAKGDVYLKTPDGDVLNLKSRLTQLLALSSAIDWETSGRPPLPARIWMTNPVCSA